MKRYTFSSFFIHDGNREACETARRIADLEPVAPLPVLLLGDEGSGKTHLLYAIVNRLRSSSSNTGLAYVTPLDFPDQVRALVDDPSPVQRAKTAVLLIDQLDSVDQLGSSSDLVEELEAVVRIFLDCHHTVIFASNVHPSRLRSLTEGLHALIDSGQVLSIEAASGNERVEMVEERTRQESAETIERLRQEVADLRAQLEKDRNETSDSMAASERADLEQRLEVAKAFGESLQRDLASAREEIARLRQIEAESPDSERRAQELESVRREMASLQDEVTRLQEASASAKAEAASSREAEEQAANYRAEMERENEGLRGEVQRLQAALADQQGQETELDAIKSERDALRAELDEARRGADEAARLRQELATVRQEHNDARSEANRLVERAEGLLELIESNRARFAEVEAGQKKQIAELEGLLAERNAQAISPEDLEAATSRAADAESLLEKERANFAAREQEWQGRIAEIESDAAGVRDAHDRTKAERDSLQSDVTALKEENAGLREDIDELSGRVESLRRHLEEKQVAMDEVVQSASIERAQFEAQAADLEHRLHTAEQELAALREASVMSASDLSDFADEMRNGADELSNFVARLRKAAGAEEAEESPVDSADSFPAFAPNEGPEPPLDAAPETFDTTAESGSGNGEHHHEGFADFDFPQDPESPAGAQLDDEEDPSI